MSCTPEERDELRARFTVWMERLLYRAKIDYIRQLKSVPNEVSLDSIEQTKFTEELHEVVSFENFEFENESLRAAFSKLPPKKREVLRLLFLEQLDPEDVAKRLGCSVGNIYNLRSMALKTIKEKMGDISNRKK